MSAAESPELLGALGTGHRARGTVYGALLGPGAHRQLQLPAEEQGPWLCTSEVSELRLCLPHMAGVSFNHPHPIPARCRRRRKRRRSGRRWPG